MSNRIQQLQQKYSLELGAAVAGELKGGGECFECGQPDPEFYHMTPFPGRLLCRGCKDREFSATDRLQQNRLKDDP